MALLKISKNTKEANKNAVKKAKAPTVSKAVKSAGGIAGAVQQMIAHAETKLGKYKDEYIVVNDIQQFKDYISSCKKDIYAAIDTETTGLNCFTDKVVGICLYSKSNKPAYIPLLHKSYMTGVKSKNQLEQELIKEELSNCKQIKWIMHNADFDIRFLRHSLGIYLICYWDTMIASKMLDENLKSHSLKDLHLLYCNSKDSEALSFDKLFNGVTFDNIPISTAYLYAAGDPVKTFELYEYQKAQFEKPGMEKVYGVFLNIEMPIVNVVADMEDLGIAFDFDRANELSTKYNKMRTEAVNAAHETLLLYQEEIENYKMRNQNCKLDNPINLKSPTQLAILFYDILGLKSPVKKSPRGTGEEILKEFAKGKEKDLCEAILKLRGLEKLLDTYIDKMPQLGARTGRVHARFNQLGARTGRFSSNDPNLQNIPSRNKEIRTMFKATDGYKLIGGDYSKQEIFVAASISQDESFIESCKQPGDIYSAVAAGVYNVPYEECCEERPDGTKNPEGKTRRGNVKAVVLGILYSKEVPSIATDLGITRQKAQQVYDKVLSSFPRLKDFMAQSQENARTLGYVETAWGRRRHLPDMQLEPYAFELINAVPLDFDPLSFTNTEIDLEVPKKVKDSYTKQLQKAFGFKAKGAILAEAKEKGIKIKDNTGFIAEATRQCVNSRVQGSAGDMVKVAMILMHNNQELKDLGYRMLVPIHDEILGECPSENVDKCIPLIEKLMKQAAEGVICVPMKVDFDISTNWNEVK